MGRPVGRVEGDSLGCVVGCSDGVVVGPTVGRPAHHSRTQNNESMRCIWYKIYEHGACFA